MIATEVSMFFILFTFARPESNEPTVFFHGVRLFFQRGIPNVLDLFY